MDEYSGRSVYVYAAGQMGNQLFQRAAAEYVRLNNTNLNRGIVLKTSVIKIDSVFAGYSIFQIGSVQTRIFGYLLSRGASGKFRKFSMIKIVLCLIIQLIFYLKSRDIVHIHVSNSIVDKPPTNIKNRSILLIGYFQNYYWRCQDQEMRENLKFIHQNWSNDSVEQRQAIVIHLRLTDYLNEPRIGLLDPNFYATALRYLEQIDKKSSPIVVCTDDSTMAQRQIESSLTADAILGPDSQTPQEAFMSIARSKIKIISNSTFSWWAAYFSEPHSIVLYPYPWFRKLNGMYEFPDGWIAIDAIWSSSNNDID